MNLEVKREESVDSEWFIKFEEEESQSFDPSAKKAYLPEATLCKVEVEESTRSSLQNQIEISKQPESIKREVSEESWSINLEERGIDDLRVERLLIYSKKISKARVKNENRNSCQFEDFFRKWSELKKTDRDFKQQTRFWWSNFSRSRYPNSIYRIFFNSVRVHFVLTVDEKMFTFENMKEEDWKELFLNLIEYFIERVYEMGDTFEINTKSRYCTVQIRGLNSFRTLS